MLKLENVLQLKPNEEIRFVAKRHAATAFPRLVMALLLIVVPCFFLFALFQRGPVGMGVFFVAVFTGLFLAWRTLAMWDGDTFVVSSVRIVKVFQAGLFSRTVTEAALSRLSDVSWGKHGLFGMLFNFGDLSMVSSGQQKIVISRIANPKAVHALLIEAIERVHANAAAAESARRARIERILSHVERLDDTELSALERSFAEDNPPPRAAETHRTGVHAGEIKIAHIGDHDHRLKPIADV